MEVDVYEFLGKWGDTVRAMQATVPDNEEDEATLFCARAAPTSSKPPVGKQTLNIHIICLRLRRTQPTLRCRSLLP